MGIKTVRKEVVHKSWDKVPVSATCDICGEELVMTRPKENDDQVDLYNFYEITTHHHDWANDSCESYEHFIACCPECAIKFMKFYLEENFEQFSTKEIEIERRDRLDYACHN